MPGRANKTGGLFAGLKVRYKLMILHNLFFLVFAGTVWFTLVPMIERSAAEAQERETRLLGSLSELAGERGVELSLMPYDYRSLVRHSELTLAASLALVYVLAVMALELWLMRRYIYRPLRVLLEADEASREGQTGSELIDEEYIHGDELGQLMSSRNATVRKLRQREQDLARKNELLETAKQNIADQDRLASLGLLSASVAHELNTPLAVLHGSIEKLMETEEDEASRDRLERMLRVTQRLQKMSDSLVDFARVRHTDMRPVAVRPLIEESWHLVAIDARAAGVRFTNRVAEDGWVVGNQDRLVQLFVNLLRNAVHAVQPGGRIEAESRRAFAYGRDCVFVSVIDDGPGIPPDVLPEVFEAFVTTRLDARGTGLGLTVAEGIAHQHGGSITATNREEGGACLEVRLPAAVGVAAPREGR